MFIMRKMRRIAILLTVAICVCDPSGALTGPLVQTGPAVAESFLMTVAEDGKNIPDNFEVWEISCDLGEQSCSIKVASFLVSDLTRVYLWNHEAKTITEVRPGIYGIEMNGRSSSFSGLEVVIEISGDGSRILDVSGSMRIGVKGQSVRVFHVDRKTQSKRIPPLNNPSWLRETK